MIGGGAQRKPRRARPDDKARTTGESGRTVDEYLRDMAHSLGRLEEGLKHLQADIEEGRVSRVRMYDKLEKIEEDVGIVGQVAAQARAEAAGVKRLVDEDVKPATDDFKRMQAVGTGIAWLIGVAGAAAGVSLATFGETVVNAIRSWLRIP